MIRCSRSLSSSDARGKSNRGVSPSGYIPAHLFENSTPAICGSMFWPRCHEAGLVRPETSMALCSFCHFRTDSELSSLIMVWGIEVVFKVWGGIVEGGGIVDGRSSLRVGRRWKGGYVEGGGGGEGTLGSSTPSPVTSCEAEFSLRFGTDLLRLSVVIRNRRH